jgi:uncharacterized protein YdaU (DUF1376 family)
MKKSTYYFSHDYNAANDVKILFMRQQLGMEGYGIYWFLIEHLADAGGCLPMKIIPVLAMQMQSQEVKVRAVISEFELFQLVDDEFFSLRLIKSLDKMNELKFNNSVKGKLSAEKRKLTAVQPQLNTGSTSVQQRKGKERKGNEIKVKNTFSDFFLEKWNEWIDYKKTSFSFTYKTSSSMQIAFDNLVKLSDNHEQNAIDIINQSIANGWKGFFQLKTNQNGKTITTPEEKFNAYVEYANRWNPESNTKQNNL